MPSALPSHLLFGAASARGPAERVEDGQGVEVIPPVHHLAVAQGQNGDIAVAVWGSGSDDLACGGVLQDDRALSRVVVHGQAHLLSINSYRLDLPLSTGEWLVTRHRDQPGIIGAVGQLLGAANVNIGFMQLGRDEPRGMALMVVGVDAPVPDDVFARVEALPPIESARRVRID